MRDIVPLLLVLVNCCIGPIIVFSLGVLVGRHGSPIQINTAWRNLKSSRDKRVLTD
jgi:hypothetical protein